MLFQQGKYVSQSSIKASSCAPVVEMVAIQHKDIQIMEVLQIKQDSNKIAIFSILLCQVMTVSCSLKA